MQTELMFFKHNIYKRFELQGGYITCNFFLFIGIAVLIDTAIFYINKYE